MISEKIRSFGWPVSGISGIRSVSDISVLKDIFGKDFVLIDVYVSDPRERYRRMINRGEGRDPKSYGQFQEQDKAEEELFHVNDAEKLADYRISNDGSLSEMHKAIENLVKNEFLLGR
jgi:dephospho-CoA kinase